MANNPTTWIDPSGHGVEAENIIAPTLTNKMVAQAAMQIAFRAAAKLIAVVCAARSCTFGGVLMLFAAGVVGCFLDLGSACWTDAVGNATAVLHYGSTSAAGAWTLAGPAPRYGWQHFPGLPRGPLCALGAAEGIATNAVASALGGNHSSASDTTLAAAMGCASGGSSGGSGSGGDDGVIRRITVIDQQGNTFEFRLEGPKGVLTVITDVDREGDTLILRGLHVYGEPGSEVGPNTLGIGELREFARLLGKQEGAAEVEI